MSDNYVRSNYRYREQQQFLNELAVKHGFYIYRPDYHAAPRDANTVLFYTLEDEWHNKKVDGQMFRYSCSEACDRMKMGLLIPDFQVYREHFFSVENTDVNGLYDMGFMNFGKIDLRGLDWRDRLEGAILVAFAKKKQYDYAKTHGGFGNLREADQVYNDLNREVIQAFYQKHGKAFLGAINFHGDERKRVQTGKKSVYTPYTGQTVYNFGCSFVVPEMDSKLEDMIREWNRNDKLPANTDLVECITQRVEKIGGISFLWY